MSVRAVAIVDPYEAGAMLAPAFAGQGVACVMVTSTPETPAEVSVRPDPADFAHRVPWSDDAAQTAAELRAQGVERVIAGSERGVILADALAERLSVPGNGTRSSEARRDKFAMIAQVGGCGIRVPRQIRSARLDEILAWIEAVGNWPAVLKPARSLGSDSVRLCATPEEVAAAFDLIHGRPDRMGWRNDIVLAQQYLSGPEYIVDTVSRDGRHRLAGLWAYGKPAARFDTVGLLSTKELLPPDGPLADLLFAFAASVLDALEIRHGAGHCELIVDAHGPTLVEIGARLHGGPPAHLMCRAATGTSQLDLLVQSCVDPAAFLDGPARAYRLAGGATMAVLYDDSLRGEIEALPSAQRVVWNGWEGDRPPGSAGLITLIHPDREVVGADLEIVTGGIDCEMLTSREAVEAIAPAWRALLDGSRCSRAFGGPSWYLAALTANPELFPSVVAAFRDGRLAGLLPLAWDVERRTARFPTMLSGYNDVVVAPGDVAAARRVLTFARADLPRLDLACIRADSDCARAEPRAPAAGDKRLAFGFADLSAGYEAWRDSRSLGFRRHLEAVSGRSARDGLRVGRLDPEREGELDPAALFIDLHRRRFGPRSRYQRDPAARTFVENALPTLVREGSALLFGAWAGDELVGLSVCMMGADSLAHWDAGYRPGLASYAPATLLLHAGLREACALGLKEFELLRGAGRPGRQWSTGLRDIARLS